jgi:hypothetical protein
VGKIGVWIHARDLVVSAVNRAVLDPVNNTLHPFDILMKEEDDDTGERAVIGFVSSCTNGRVGLCSARANASLVRDACKKYYQFDVKTVVFRFNKDGGMRPVYCEGWENENGTE